MADPTLGGPHREIANMLGRMGEFEKALKYSNQALELWPDDEHAIADREDYLPINRLEESMFTEEDSNWAVYEYLAKNKPKKALTAIKKPMGTLDLRAAAHCYGALEMSQDYLEAWKEIAMTQKEIEITYEDWFFMEDAVYMKPAVWEILLSSSAIFSGVFTVFEGLDESKRYTALSTHEQIRLAMQYYVFAQSDDKKSLKKFGKAYPEWKELADELNK